MAKEKDLSRRNFFRFGMGKATELGTNIIEQKVGLKVKNWIRPPFAIAELDFLLACNRCGECINSCPYGVVFALPATKGIEVAATPAMDILNKGCHLCTDWHCVSSCPSGALSFIGDNIAKPKAGVNEDETLEVELPIAAACPPMAKANINIAECMPYSGPECGACKGSCPIPNTLNWANEKPSINQALCIGCGLCREACITLPKAIDISAL